MPVLIPLTGAAVAVLLRRRPRLQGWWALGTMLTAAASSLVLLATVWQSGQSQVFQSGAWAAPFGITLAGDLLGATMVVMSQVVLVAGLLYALGCADRCVSYPAFYPLFLTLATGLSGVMLTGDLFNLFVFAELLVISGALLTALSDDRSGVEAAYKYFYISLLAATFLLLAIGSLYVSYGTLNLADLASRVRLDPGAPLLPVAIVLMLAFFMVKSAVVPFHFWQPDFHTAAPTPVSAMLSSVVVKVGVYGFLRMTTLLFVAQAVWIRPILLVLGMVGVVFGGLAAIGTHNAKRMLAYSTLGQIGFILVAIGWGTPLALAAAVVFAVNHSVVKAAMLMLAGAVASRASVKSAAFSVVRGVGAVTPAAGLLFLIGGLALAGIPPTNGFVSKLSVFQSGIEAAQFPSLIFIGLASILTVIYVGRAFQAIWWEPPPAEAGPPKAKGDRLLAPALLIGLCLLLGLWGQPLLALAADTSRWLGEPALYVRAVLGG